MRLLTKKKFLSLFSSLSLLPLISSCQLGESYETPDVYVPAHWKTSISSKSEQITPTSWKTDLEEETVDEENGLICGEATHTEPPANTIFANPCDKPLENWWDVFNDPTLHELEVQAVESNYSLWAAMERVKAARALAGVASSYRWPSIGFGPSFSRSGELIENPLSGSQIGQNTQNPLAAAATQRVPEKFRFVNTAYTLPLDFTYEVDLWGRLTNAYYAADLRAEAAYDDYFSVLITLTADVAINYFQLRGLDSQKKVLEKTIQTRQQALDINRARYQAGLVNLSDVTRAQEQLSTAKADYVDVGRQRALQENILAVLIGKPAPEFSLAFNPIQSVPPSVPVGLPSELLYRRPDVAESERLLAAAYADISVANANFYPSLRLSATLGLESPFLASLFSWQARLWSIGANVMQTVFSAGRNSANLLYYIAQYRQALNNYQENVLVAFKDVEDALVNLKQRAQLSKELDDATKAASQTLELSRIRYLRGLVNYLEVTDAERNMLNDQLRADIVLAQRYIDTVMLIKALGGGWEDPSLIGFQDACEKDPSTED